MGMARSLRLSVCAALWLGARGFVCAHSLGQGTRSRLSAVPMTMEGTFAQLYGDALPPWLLSRCAELGFTRPTAAQLIALPRILNGSDCILQSMTGSGKTLAFALPILAKIDPTRAAIQAVVIAPTRELGLQIAAVLKQLAAGSPDKVMVMSVVEGSRNRRQQIWAVAEPPHIVVGNPKSLQRLVDSGRLRLNAVRFVVVDEVDASLIAAETRAELHALLSRTLSNSFQSADAVEEGAPMQENLVYSNLAKDARDMSQEAFRSSRQTILCSATVPQRQHFAVSCLKNGWTETLPEVIHVTPDHLIPAQIEHEYVECEAALRLACLRYLLGKESERSGGAGFQAMVFTEGHSQHSSAALRGAAEAALGLEGEGPRVQVLDGDASLDARAKVMADFSVLLCADGASRGLDVPGVDLIVQMALPQGIDTYLHRAGRTGRQGAAGRVVTLTAPGEDFVIQRLSNELNIAIERRTLKTKKRPAV